MNCKTVFLFISVALLSASQADAMLPLRRLIPTLISNSSMSHAQRRGFFSGRLFGKKRTTKTSCQNCQGDKNPYRDILLGDSRQHYLDTYAREQWLKNPCVTNPLFWKRYEHSRNGKKGRIRSFCKALITSRPVASLRHSVAVSFMDWLPVRSYIVDNCNPNRNKMAGDIVSEAMQRIHGKKISRNLPAELIVDGRVSDPQLPLNQHYQCQCVDSKTIPGGVRATIGNALEYAAKKIRK